MEMLEQFRSGQAYQHIERAQSLERQGRLDEAMLEFKRAVEADPRIAASHNALGQHYLRKGLITKAADEFHTATLLMPDYDNCFNLGRALTELERYAEAAEAFQQCLAADKSDPSARYELAYLQCAIGQFSEALAQFQSLVQEFPTDWELRLGLADCYLGMANYQAAADTLHEALQNVPPDTDTAALRETLGLARRHLEFPPEAELGLKDRLYVDYGIVCLGSGRDYGLDIPIYDQHTFTYVDVAVTVSRLLALIGAYDWLFDAIVSVDADSEPLAIALSRLLGIPVVPVQALDKENLVLAVLGLTDQRELYDVTLESIPGRAVSLALAVNLPPTEGPLADVVGAYCSGKAVLPWQRLRKQSAEAAATSILRALPNVPPEDNRREQMAYYADQHTLLRFVEPPPEEPNRLP